MRINRTRKPSSLAILVCASLLASCSTPIDPPVPSVALSKIGKRLSALKSADELRRISVEESRLLRQLTDDERDDLGRGHLRFPIDRPATIFVATIPNHIPFWLEDQGFEPRPGSFFDEGSFRVLYAKHFEPGEIGLGVDRLDARESAHYEVFVKPDDLKPLEFQSLNLQNWQVDVPRKPPTDALRGASRLRPNEALRNSTVLAKGKVWKTHVESRNQPDQIHVTPGMDPSSDLVVTWRTLPESARSVIRFRLHDRPSDVIEVQGESTPLRTPSVMNDPEVRIHHARLSGLEPDQSYDYAVGDGTPERMSKWSTIRTAPRPGTDLQLLYMGDPQCGLEGWGRLLGGALERHPKANALLIAGDLVDRGNERTNWDHFFLRAAGVFDRITLLPAVGNHEYLDMGPKLYRSFFNLPRNGPSGSDPGLVYSVELGDAFIAVLDSTMAVSDPDSAARQGEWLRNRLKETARRWKIVMFHHPLYASHPWRESLALREAWGPIFDECGVDLVLQGHDHAYLRTYPMKGGSRMTSTSNGTTYVVSVSGDKYCEQRESDYAEVGFTNRSTYQTIDLKSRERRMIYRSLDGEGTVLDQVEWNARERSDVARR